MKTSDLIGPALDWAVAQCEDPDMAAVIADCGIIFEGYHYSTDWAQGGPIIEREKITVTPCRMDGQSGWVACTHTYIWGETPLIAAMRCYVASKLGDDVEIPEELK